MSYAICLKCQSLLKSETVHEFSMCKCENQSFIDGGNEYLRLGGADMDAILMLDENTYEALCWGAPRGVGLICAAALKGIKQAREQAYCIGKEVGKTYANEIQPTSPIGGGL